MHTTRLPPGLSVCDSPVFVIRKPLAERAVQKSYGDKEKSLFILKCNKTISSFYCTSV